MITEELDKYLVEFRERANNQPTPIRFVGFINSCKNKKILNQPLKYNKDYLREKQKAYYLTHKEQKSEYNRIYRETHKEYFKEYNEQRKSKYNHR